MSEYFLKLPVSSEKYRHTIALVFMILLTGCASFNSQKVGDHVNKSTEKQSNIADAEDVSSFETETLYDLLVAEVSGQRQHYDLELGNYLKQAHKTRDIGVIQRAYELAVQLGARQAALDASLLWVEVQPDSLEALHKSALELVYAGQFYKAFEQMSHQISLGGDPAFDLLASAAGKSQEWFPKDSLDDLLSQMKTLSKSYPNHRSLQLGQAILLQHTGQFERALAIAHTLLKKDRGYIPAVMVKGLTLHKLQRDLEAEVLLTSALQRYPNENRLRLLYARVLVHIGKLDQAKEQFKVLLERAPEESDIVLALALITLENGLETEAEEYFYQLLNMGERTNTAHYYLGRLREKQQDYETAKDHYLSVDQGKDFMAAQVALAKMLVEQDKLEEALIYVDEARSRNPARMISLFLLEGDILVNDQQMNKALILFERALKANPESINLLYSRAMVYEKMNDLVGLERDLRLILKLDPDNTAALNALGYTLADRTDRYEEAEELVLRAYALNNKDPAILDSMGWVKFRLGNYERAEYYLRMAYKQLADAEIAAHLGEVLWQKGNTDEAKLIWSDSLRKHPDSQVLKETMNRLMKNSS